MTPGNLPTHAPSPYSSINGKQDGNFLDSHLDTGQGDTGAGNSPSVDSGPVIDLSAEAGSKPVNKAAAVPSKGVNVMRRVVTLALAALGVMAFMGMASGVASAHFYAASSPGWVEGTQAENKPHVFTVEGSEVTCKNAEFESNEVTEASVEELDVYPTYTNCTAFGFANATVNMGSCFYRFHDATEDPTATAEFRGTTSVICPSGRIRVSVSVPLLANCVVDIYGSSSGWNTNLQWVYYNNIAGSLDKVEVIADVGKIKNEVVTSAGLCPLKKGINETGIYKGPTIVEGTNGSESSDIWVAHP